MGGFLGTDTDPKEQYHKRFSGVQKTKLASPAFFLVRSGGFPC